MSFIRLMNDDGTTLSDTVHDLLMFRVSSTWVMAIYLELTLVTWLPYY